MVLPQRLEISIPPSVTSIAEAAVGRDTIMRAVASAVLQVGCGMRGMFLQLVQSCSCFVCCLPWLPTTCSRDPACGSLVTCGAALYSKASLYSLVQPGTALGACGGSTPHTRADITAGLCHEVAKAAAPTDRHVVDNVDTLSYRLLLLLLLFAPVLASLLQVDSLEQALLAALPLGPQAAAGGITLPELFRVSTSLISANDVHCGH
jgi:hypothetical protein